ncbi:hypothetical protein [Nocardioides zhouii]|uniref:Uncharacterized protein n=1 Tax=Nocardioides zhouii TaxID=1168729 RepID=A0A4Q2T6P9_9ACTN|nr:hypothetical protein [Nocardioides zhouii]RYC14565.1 hypothetical protein EUA94_00090 [Nocardioides zhouii]
MSPELIDRLATSMIIEILLNAQESYWLKRADDFAKVGNARCDIIAAACHAKATRCREEYADEWAELLALELGDVA